MQGRGKAALRSAITACGIAVSSFMLLPPGVPASAAPDNCLTAPSGAAPQGSHWYYRLERGTQRKCWRLVKKDQKEQNAAARAAPTPEGDDDADDAAPPASAAAVPAARAAAPRLAEPAAPPAAQAIVRDLFTRNVSNTDRFAQQTAVPSAEPAPAVDASPAPAPPEPTASREPPPAPAPIVEQPAPQPVVAAVANSAADASAAGTMPTLKLLLAAVAITGFLAGAIFFVMEMLRRRGDVLNRTHDAEPDTIQYDPSQGVTYELAPEVRPAEDRPTFEPLPALAPIGQREDSIEEALRRMHSRRRRAA